MRTVSTRWEETARSGDITFFQTASVLNELGESTGELDVLSGSFTEDSTGVVRLDFNLVVSDNNGALAANGVANDLVPFDKRVRITHGYRWPDGTEESTTLATGWLAGAEISTDSKTATLTGFDRAAFLQQESVRPVLVPAGRSAELAIRDLLRVVDPGLSFDLMETAWTLPRLTYEAETDLMAEGVKLAESIGAQLAMTRDDVMRLRPVPTATPPHVCTFAEGAQGTVLYASRGWTWDQIHNGVIVISQHSSLPAPVRAEAWDEDPTSFTYRYGTYGERPRRERTEKCSNFGQAQAMARGLLELELGGAETIDLRVIPDASIEVDDVAMVDLPLIGADGLWVVERVGLSLGEPGAEMDLTLRSGVTQ